jgi:hypothetical protein
MQRKIISLLLIFCLLIQLPITNIGCRAAFPTGENDLSKYVNENGHILIKLKDDTEIETFSESIFLIKDSSEFFYGKGDKYNYEDKSLSEFDGTFYNYDIDSTKSIIGNSKSYQLFWMKDNTRLSFEVGNIFIVKPDSGKSCWAVKEYSEGSVKSNKLIRIYENDISEVQEFKTTWVGYTILGLSIAAVIVLGIAGVNYQSKTSGCNGEVSEVDIFSGKF